MHNSISKADYKKDRITFIYWDPIAHLNFRKMAWYEFIVYSSGISPRVDCTDLVYIEITNLMDSLMVLNCDGGI
ncbi:hypothetical protein DYY65_05895 [Nitrososphaera sp. AFS]|nr:hypothetical protein [Nitrososphaera sp. AFS]